MIISFFFNFLKEYIVYIGQNCANPAIRRKYSVHEYFQFAVLFSYFKWTTFTDKELEAVDTHTLYQISYHHTLAFILA